MRIAYEAVHAIAGIDEVSGGRLRCVHPVDERALCVATASTRRIERREGACLRANETMHDTERIDVVARDAAVSGDALDEGALKCSMARARCIEGDRATVCTLGV